MKIYRQKRRSCKMCKPHKMGFSPMWKAKDLGRLKAMEQEQRSSERRTP